MKIENLEIHDFKCFHDLKLAFDKPVNIIFGQNAVGKSTIAQAIELALTGKLNSLGSAKMKNSLARSGAEEYSVTAVVSDQGKRLKLLQSSKERGPEMEIDKAVLACLLDSTRFLKEHPDNRKQLLFDLLGLTIEQGNLKKHLGNWLQAHPEVLAKNWRTDGDFQKLISCLEEFPKSLNQGYEEACEERKLVKREFKTFEALNAKALPQGLSVKTLAEQIRQKEEELAGLHTKIGEIRGVALGEEKSLESEISALSGKILQLEAEIKAFNPEGEKAELTRLIEEKKNLDNDLNELEEELQGLDREIITLEAIYRENEALSVRIQNFTGLCPLFREDQFICQTSEVLEAVRERKVAIRDNEKIQTLKENKKRVLEMIDRKQKRHISIEGGIISHKAGLSRFEKNEKELEVLIVKREKQVQVVKSLDGRNKEEIAAAKERVKVLQSEIDGDKAQLDLISKGARKLALEEKLGKLEVLAIAFSPKGIMGDLLSSAASRLSDEANRVMGELSGGRYRVDIDPDSLDLTLLDLPKKRKTPLSLISESEKFRLGVVFQAVLAQLSGLKFLVIDGLDILDQHNRGFFFRFMKESSRFDQIIALCTIGQYQPKNPGLKDVEFWVIEDGAAKIIEVSKAA